MKSFELYFYWCDPNPKNLEPEYHKNFLNVEAIICKIGKYNWYSISSYGK
ncbi:MAG: hypothetical protein ACTSUL_04165 [Promethearchaeota archaeon]